MNSRLRPFPVRVEPAADDGAEPVVSGKADVPGVGDVVVVASGKGGVGKSTVAVNLACVLAEHNVRVGVLDADIFGPSVARLMGTGSDLTYNDQGLPVPFDRNGVFSISIANLLPPEAALVWKGPLVVQAVLQMFRDVAWPGLDILLVDLPPGTGDVQLTILEQIDVTGAIIVTTPQKLALLDADRGTSMFHQYDVPVFGVVENMRGYVCPCCGQEQELFPAGGVRQLAGRRHVPYLGDIPTDPDAHSLADEGRPLVLAKPGGPASLALKRLAHEVNNAVMIERRGRERGRLEKEQARYREFWEMLLDDDGLQSTDRA